MAKILAFIEKMLKVLVVLCIGIMLAIVFLQVISRYAFNYTPSFAEELSRYLFVWTVFLSLPLVAKSGGHMAIETITSRISGMKLKVCRVLADLFTFSFLFIMTWYGYKMVEIAQYQTSPAMVIPMSYVYIVIPVGCAIMCLFLIGDFIKLLKTAPEDVK